VRVNGAPFTALDLMSFILQEHGPQDDERGAREKQNEEASKGDF
jgi:hypothetical protein